MKRFQLLQLLLVQELQLMESTLSRANKENTSSNTNEDETSRRRTQILQLFAAVEKELKIRMEKAEANPVHAKGEEGDPIERDAQKKEDFLLQQLARDFSNSDWQVAAWRALRNRVLAQAAAVGRCAHCGV